MHRLHGLVAAMLSRIALLLWLTSFSLGTPLPKSHHHHHSAPRKFVIRRQPSLPNIDSQTAIVAQATAMWKFRNASALLAGQGTSPGYAVPPSLQGAYDRASDYATNIPHLRSRSSSRVVVAASLNHTNTTFVDPLQDETDGIRDYEYYGPMLFGSQSQPLNIDFDTGSADVWVPVNCSNCRGLKQFRSDASSTFHNSSQPFTIRYGLGEVFGTVVRDTVTIGSFKVENQTFGAVSSVSPNFANSPNDGLVGLAFGTISSSHEPTFFENLVPQIEAPLFSVFMSRGHVYGSEICIGCVDASKAVDEHVTWVPVPSKTYWTTNLTGVSVNSLVIPTSNLLALIDTGTSYMYVPKRIASALYAQIPGSALAPGFGEGFYAYPCDLPVVVSFILGGQPLAIDARDLSLGRDANDFTNSTCIGAIIGATLEFAILGDSFCKNYVTIFDYSHGTRVGFLKSVDKY